MKIGISESEANRNRKKRTRKKWTLSMHAVYSVCFLTQMCIYSFVRFSSLKKTMMTIMMMKKWSEKARREIDDEREFTDFSFRFAINIENVLINYHQISSDKSNTKYLKYFKTWGVFNLRKLKNIKILFEYFIYKKKNNLN